MDKKVFLSACKDYDEERVKAAVRELLQGFGGAAALAGGKRVLLKPNLLMAATPASCVTTHPTVISALAEEFTAAGCRVVIADSPGGPYNSLIMKRTYARCGMEPLAQKEGVTLNYDYGSKDFAFPEGKVAKSFPLITPALEADFIVSAAKLKTHGLTHMTGAVKNVFGLVPGLIKPAYHAKFSDRAQFCRMLVDLCQAVSPHFSVIDGVMGMEGRGPSGGRPKYAGVLIGSRNPHAADLAACQIMGLSMSNVTTLTDAAERGLIPASYKELEYAGGEIQHFQQKFAPPHKTGSFIGFMPKKMRPFLEKLVVPYPYIMKEKCIGCGDCALSCPPHIIEMKERKACIDHEKCIKCYCCHELCPVRAIDFKRYGKIKRLKN